MSKLMECIPNISEGRRKDVVEAVVDEVRNTPGAALLNYSSDESHNRSVLTFVGAPEAVPFATEPAAEEFRASHGGRLVRLDDIPDDYVLGPVDLSSSMPDAHQDH